MRNRESRRGHRPGQPRGRPSLLSRPCWLHECRVRQSPRSQRHGRGQACEDAAEGMGTGAMTRRQLIGLTPVVAGLALLASLGRFPYQWGHSLSVGCQWSERDYLGAVGPGEPDAAARRSEFACWERHGLKAPDWQSIKVLLPQWPSEAELTAWNGEPHEIGRSFRPAQ